MTRFVNPFPQYILSSGSPVSGGFLRFFDTGTDDPKPVFSDPDFNDNIGNEVRLSDSGSVPDVFLDGAYRVKLFKSNGQTQLEQADPVGTDTTNLSWELWLSGNTYNIPDIVKGSDDRYYRSLANSNQGNDPTAQPSAFWEEILFHRVWNTAATYRQGAIVIASDGRTYQSQVGSNTGNDPTLDSGANWQIVLQGGDDISVGKIDINKTDPSSAGLNYLNDGTIRWSWFFETDESINLNRYNASGTLLDSVMTVTTAGDITFTRNVFVDNDIQITDGVFGIDNTSGGDPVEVQFNGNAATQKAIAFQDAGFDRWIFGQTTANAFSLARFNASGVLQGTPWFVEDGSDDVNFEGDINFTSTVHALDMTSPNGGAFDFDFSGADTENVFWQFFRQTNTSGTRLIDIYKGDGTATITFQLDADDGSIFPAQDRAGTGEQGVKLGKITLSTLAPSGGQDGDLWLRY